MLRLLFFKMFSSKVYFNPKGVSGSKHLLQHQPHRRQWAHISVAHEWIQHLLFHRHRYCDKSICRQGCFLWKEHACFLGRAAKFIFKWRKLRFKAANPSAVPGCLQEQPAVWLPFASARTECPVFAQNHSKQLKRNSSSRDLKRGV